MVAVKYILANPEFKPTQSVEQSADDNLKACISGTPSLHCIRFPHSEITAASIDDKSVNYPHLTNENYHNRSINIDI